MTRLLWVDQSGCCHAWAQEWFGSLRIYLAILRQSHMEVSEVMGVPLNHPFRHGFSIKKKPPLCSTLFYFGDSPIHGPPHMLLDFPAGRLQSRQLMCSAQVPSSPHSFCPPPSFRWGPNGWLQMIIEIHVEFHVEIWKHDTFYYHFFKRMLANFSGIRAEIMLKNQSDKRLTGADPLW